MENASKALIIAGAILLSILIISLGILIFSQAQDTINAVNMNEQEILAFNNKFTPYEGDSIRGSQVNALLQAVVSSNQSVNDNGEITTKGIRVIFEDDDLGESFEVAECLNQNFTLSKVKTGTYYKVELKREKSLVREVVISNKPS